MPTSPLDEADDCVALKAAVLNVEVPAPFIGLRYSLVEDFVTNHCNVEIN